MPDPFSDKHAKDNAKATKDAHAADRPANWDIGMPWRKNFYEPGY